MDEASFKICRLAGLIVKCCTFAGCVGNGGEGWGEVCKSCSVKIWRWSPAPHVVAKLLNIVQLSFPGHASLHQLKWACITDDTEGAAV
jgi:hypothetical protein